MVKPRPIILRDEAIRERVLVVIAALNIETLWQVTIQPHKRSRSLEQNNTYHWWIGIIAQETGNSHDAVHEFCKDEFLPPVFVELGGKTKEIRRSTTTLKVDEMSAYMEAVHAWAVSVLGIVLPLPEEMGRAA